MLGRRRCAEQETPGGTEPRIKLMSVTLQRFQRLHQNTGCTAFTCVSTCERAGSWTGLRAEFPEGAGNAPSQQTCAPGPVSTLTQTKPRPATHILERGLKGLAILILGLGRALDRLGQHQHARGRPLGQAAPKGGGLRGRDRREQGLRDARHTRSAAGGGAAAVTPSPLPAMDSQAGLPPSQTRPSPLAQPVVQRQQRHKRTTPPLPSRTLQRPAPPWRARRCRGCRLPRTARGGG